MIQVDYHMLFVSGLRGSGKTSTARIMAKALLYLQGLQKPCRVWITVKVQIQIDILILLKWMPASNRGIDDIKDLIEHTKYKLVQQDLKSLSSMKFICFTTQAFNALLKLLEPPGFVKFILCNYRPIKITCNDFK